MPNFITGMFRETIPQESRALVATAQRSVLQHAAQPMCDIDGAALVARTARKTASVVAEEAHPIPNFITGMFRGTIPQESRAIVAPDQKSLCETDIQKM